MAKQKNNNATGPGFSESIEESLPNIGNLDSIYEAAKKIPGTRTVSVDDPANPYNVAFEHLDYNYVHEVFVIYRPWWACHQCKDDVAGSRTKLPATGTVRCPHTEREAYILQMNRFLKEGHIRQSQREETLMDGSIQVSVAWMVPVVNEKKRDAAKKKSVAVTSEDP